MIKSQLSLAFVFLTASALPSQGIEVSVNPTADSTVDAINPNATDSNGQLLAAAEGAFEQPATTLSFIYTQFTLPDGLTGQDIGAINSVDLQFSRVNPGAVLSLTYYSYGVFDGFDFGSADNYVWNDGIGFFPENTEIRNFADENELSYYSDPAESSFIGTTETGLGGDPSAPLGLFFVHDNFRDLLKNDTDGKITFYTKVRQNFPATNAQPFESIEDVSAFTGPPTLIFDYSEPLDGDFDNNGVINGVDFLLWQRGESPNGATPGDLALWQDNYGVVPPSTVMATPEPATCLFTIVGFGFLGCASRSRKRRGQ
ncbi:hypothetical protein OAS39_03445 [Pirellulales bacterium]|nr:hypothetical protein [Pirellulales bacterium]